MSQENLDARGIVRTPLGTKSTPGEQSKISLASSNDTYNTVSAPNSGRGDRPSGVLNPDEGVPAVTNRGNSQGDDIGRVEVTLDDNGNLVYKQVPIVLSPEEYINKIMEQFEEDSARLDELQQKADALCWNPNPRRFIRKPRKVVEKVYNLDKMGAFAIKSLAMKILDVKNGMSDEVKTMYNELMYSKSRKIVLRE
jgi:hypothetical protein